MNLIAVVDEKWGIAKDGGLLIHLPNELKYFKSKTLNKIVVMGRETLESLPGGKPLPDRRNIVLSRNPSYNPPCEVCNSMGALFKLLESENMEDVFIAGGENVYRQFAPYCNRYFITKLQKDFGADMFLNNLDLSDELKLVWQSETNTEKGINYVFTEYIKR